MALTPKCLKGSAPAGELYKDLRVNFNLETDSENADAEKVTYMHFAVTVLPRTSNQKASAMLSPACPRGCLFAMRTKLAKVIQALLQFTQWVLPRIGFTCGLDLHFSTNAPSPVTLSTVNTCLELCGRYGRLRSLTLEYHGRYSKDSSICPFQSI